MAIVLAVFMRKIANHQTIFLKSPPPYSQTRLQMYKGFGLTGADLQMIHGLRKGLSTCEVWVMGATNHHRHHCHCHQLQTAVTRVLDDLERNSQSVWKKRDINQNTYLLPANSIDGKDSHSYHHYWRFS